MKYTYPFFDTPNRGKNMLLSVSKKRYQIIALALCLLFGIALALQPSTVYADPTSTPIIIATSQFQNLLPSPTPLATSNATMLPLVDNDLPRQYIYTGINTYHFFNNNGLLDLVAFAAFGVFTVVWIIRLINRLKRAD